MEQTKLAFSRHCIYQLLHRPPFRPSPDEYAHNSLQQLWVHIFTTTSQKRSSIRGGRSNAVGPLAVLQQATNALGWNWLEPFLFEVAVGHSRVIRLRILQHSQEYFFCISRDLELAVRYGLVQLPHGRT